MRPGGGGGVDNFPKKFLKLFLRISSRLFFVGCRSVCVPCYVCVVSQVLYSTTQGRIQGGGGGRLPPPQGFDNPLPTRSTILRYPFLVTDPKIVLKAHWGQYILILRGERGPYFFFLQKVPQKAFLAFSKICLGAENLVKLRSL